MENNKTSRLANFIEIIEKKIDFFARNPIFALAIIGVLALVLRLLFFEPGIPIRQDANAYFWYANDMSILRNFPISTHANNGWPIFLSIFFSIFHFSNFTDYTILQRLVTISISILTVIPVYLLCIKFFDKKYSLVGAGLFAFEPHIIQNSLLGLTEPLYIFLGISGLALFLSTNKKIMYASFAVAALSTIVRAEGIVLLVIFSIMFFVRYRKEKVVIGKYLLGLAIFCIILFPLIIINFQIAGHDGTSNHIVGFTYYSLTEPEKSGVTFPNFIKAVETLAKRLGQSMIPYFAFFVPFGILLLFKNRDHNKLLIILTIVIYLIAATRMFFVVYDLRLILFLYPLFTILSVFTIKYLGDGLVNKNTFLVLLLGGAILLSWFFLYNNSNTEYEKEAYRFTTHLIENVKIINNYYPESGYIYAAWASSHLTFPILSSAATYTGPEALDYLKDSFDYLEKNANSVEEYIKLARNQGLTHLVVDGTKNRASYFNDVFYNEEKYPYLIKEFDSRENGYKYYYVKILKIDYNRFDSIGKQ